MFYGCVIVKIRNFYSEVQTTRKEIIILLRPVYEDLILSSVFLQFYK